jgi:hypothetical protein
MFKFHGDEFNGEGYRALERNNNKHYKNKRFKKKVSNLIRRNITRTKDF